MSFSVHITFSAKKTVKLKNPFLVYLYNKQIENKKTKSL